MKIRFWDCRDQLQEDSRRDSQQFQNSFCPCSLSFSRATNCASAKSRNAMVSSRIKPTAVQSQHYNCFHWVRRKMSLKHDSFSGFFSHRFQRACLTQREIDQRAVGADTWPGRTLSTAPGLPVLLFRPLWQAQFASENCHIAENIFSPRRSGNGERP